MTLTFWDSSGLLKLLVEEPGTDIAVPLWDEATAVAVSRLAVPEVHAALAAALRIGRIDADRRRAAASEWRRYLAAVDVVELTPTVGDHAADLAAAHPLSGADAVQLASALALASGTGAVILATWDRRLASAAWAEGLNVVPALE